MELPINDKELNTIISAMRLGGDAALYQKLRRLKEIRDENGTDTQEEFGFVL